MAWYSQALDFSVTFVADPQHLPFLAALGRLVRHFRVGRERSLSEIASRVGLAESDLAALENGQVDVSYATVLLLADALDLDGPDFWRRCEPAEFRAFHVQDVQPDAYQMLIEGYRPWHIVRDKRQFRPGDRIHLREVATGRATGRWMRTTIAYVERLADVAPGFAVLTFDVGRYAGAFNDCESSGEG
jgi:transcriptional regulator with XRE-family HTH domain